jgi:hypothetical protein
LKWIGFPDFRVVWIMGGWAWRYSGLMRPDARADADKSCESKDGERE